MVMNTMILLIQIPELLKPSSETLFNLYVAYTVNSVLVYSLVVPSFFNKKYEFLVRFGFMLCAVRPLVYAFLYEPLGIRGERDDTAWYVASQV